MSDWKPIDTAPKDGSTITVKREYEDRIIYEGPAEWRTVRFPAIPPHPLGDAPLPGDEAHDETGWMHPAGTQDLRVPEPTHWKL